MQLKKFTFLGFSLVRMHSVSVTQGADSPPRLSSSRREGRQKSPWASERPPPPPNWIGSDLVKPYQLYD
jgi:hypothetical protein